MPAPVNPGMARDARPHLVGADRFVGDRHERRHVDVAREVIDLGAERLDLRRVRLENGAFGEQLLDPQPVARGDRRTSSAVPWTMTSTGVADFEATCF